ncbi:MAG: hypothetical protein GX295_00170 [Syntrophomonadaceae bacterium]|nr:hypothetical protein [Syntrophomonadaceae bacterium]
MVNLMRKAFFLGLGGVSLVREKAEEIVDELVAKKDIEPTEAKRVVKELIEKGEQEREALKGFIQKEISQWRSELGLVTRDEIKHLEERLKVLEERLQASEKPGEANP